MLAFFGPVLFDKEMKKSLAFDFFIQIVSLVEVSGMDGSVSVVHPSMMSISPLACPFSHWFSFLRDPLSTWSYF